MSNWVVVHEGSGPVSPGSKKMLERLVRQAGGPADLSYIPLSVATVAQTRKATPALQEQLQAEVLDRILTMGPFALMAVRGDHTKNAISNERGRLQRVTLGRLDAVLLPTIDPAIVWTDNEFFRDFARDVLKWASGGDPQVVTYPEYWEAVTNSELEEGLAELDPYDVVSLDVETTGTDPLVHDLLSIGIGTSDGPITIIPHQRLASSRTKDLVWDFLWPEDGRKRRTVLHNGKFDLMFLARWWGALPSEALLGDTMLLHYLLDERPVRSKYRTHGLKDIARVRYDVADYGFDHEAFQARYRGDEGTEPLTEDDWHAMHQYHAMDCRITAMLWEDLVPEAEADSEGLLRCHDEVLMPATLALAESELRGIPVDLGFLHREKRRLERRIQRRGDALRRWVGNPDFKPGSPAQLVKVIKEQMGIDEAHWPGRISGAKAYHRKTKTPTGVGELKQLVARFLREERHQEARFLSSMLAWRLDDKQLSTYVDGWLEAMGPDNRIHPSFNLGGTVTGRLSSDHPNMQAVPKYGSMVPVRKQVRAPAGWQLLEADYSQLELRTAAMMSGDPDLRQVYIDGRDLHLEVAAMLFEKQVNNVSDEERFMAKALNFGILYGRSGWAISKGDEMTYAVEKLHMERWTPDEGDEYIEKWMEGFPVLRAWVQDMKVLASDRRYTETPVGRRRRFFITRTDPRIISAFQRQAVNTPVQSLASDICLMAFNRVSAAIDRTYAHPISIVHDSILLEVREGREQEIALEVKRLMEDPPTIWSGLPLVVDIKVGRTLAEEDMTKVTFA